MDVVMGNGFTGPVTRRVLLAEDNEINAAIAAIQLKDINMEVDWVRDGAQAVSTFEASEENYYDLILMDIMMPVMDGNEAIQKIRNLDRNDSSSIPIIAISANGFTGVSQDEADKHINYFITKPYNKRELQGVVMSLLEKEAAV